MSSDLLLDGGQEYVDHGPDPRISKYEAEIRDLRRKLSHAELEATHAKEGVAHTLSSLRSMTLPFYNLLRAIHGEIEAIGIVDTPSSSAPMAPQFDQRWEAWKQKLGPETTAARVIDAILSHGPMNNVQLKAACKAGSSTIEQVVARLRNLSLIEKISGKWDLKK